jgi:alpha/beta superfamily hydrolase
MAFNFMGYPFGAIIAGALATDSIPAAVILSVIASLVAGILAFRLIPRTVPPATWADTSPSAEA